MKTVREIFDYLCTLAPLELQEDFDNAGFLLGREETGVDRALLALDITGPVIEEAVEKKAKLIVSHHPLIFHPLKAITGGGAGEKVLRLAENGIAAICMHTNLDIAKGGVNDVLIRLLGAQPEQALDAEGCGRVGTLPEPVAMADFLALCKERLHTKGLRYVASDRPVRRLAVMGGSGGGALEDAVRLGCDTYVTADIKYNQFLDAAELGLNLIDADHFCTEDPVIPVLAEKLRARFPDVDFAVSERHGQVISFL